MKNQYSAKFIKDMPKNDLHLHLDGSLRLSSLIEMSKKTNTILPSNTEEGMRELVFKKKYANLGEYLEGFKYTCDVLRDMENLEQAAYELAIDNQEEGVNYIEVRFAPQLLTDSAKGITIEKVLTAVNTGLNKAKGEYNNSNAVTVEGKPQFHYGIINCAMRMFGPTGFSPYYTNLFKVMNFFAPIQVINLAAMELARASVHLRDNKGLPIVGLDLAGQEEGYPAGKFKDVYEYAHKHFMRKTIHAGEAYGAESIFEAITECYADRIGHGYSLFMPELIVHRDITDKQRFIDNLISYMSDKRTIIEVCLTSNMQTNPNIKNIKDHVFKHMLENRMATTICTDNRLVSDTTVSNEYKLALENFDIPLKRLKDIVAYGYKKSFHPGTYVEKREFAKINMQYFDKIATKHGII